MPVALVDARLSPSFLLKSSERRPRAMRQARSLTIENAVTTLMIDAHDELFAILRDVLGTTPTMGA